MKRDVALYLMAAAVIPPVVLGFWHRPHMLVPAAIGVTLVALALWLIIRHANRNY